EKRLGMSTGDIMRKLGTFSIETARDIIHALLQKFHAKEFPNTDAGREQVGYLIDDAGGIAAFFKMISEAVGVRKDNKADEEVAEKGPNPPEAQAGTGESSPLKLAVSA